MTEFIPPRVPQADVERMMRQAQELVPLIRRTEQMAHLQEAADKFAEWLRPHWPVIQETLRLVAAENSTVGVLDRQREAMASIQSGFIDWPIPTPAELEEAQASLQRHLPETPEEIEQVGQRAATIMADPEQGKLIERMTGALKQADLSKVPRVAIPLTVYFSLCHHLGLPLDGQVTGAQHSDFLGVITIVLMVAFWLWPSS